jgi:hypothetical protein
MFVATRSFAAGQALDHRPSFSPAVRRLSHADLCALDNVEPVNSCADQIGEPRFIEANVLARHPTRHSNLARYNVTLIDHPVFAYAYGVSAMPGDHVAIRDFGVINKTHHRGIDCRPNTGASVIIQSRRWFQADLSWPDVVYAAWEWRLWNAFGPDFFKVMADNPRALDTHANFRHSWPTTKTWLKKLCVQIVARTADAEATIDSAGFDVALARDLEMNASEKALALAERVRHLAACEFCRADFPANGVKVHRIARPVIAEILAQCLLPNRNILDAAAWLRGLVVRSAALTRPGPRLRA